MSRVRNILFVMCDQLRADYLSCMGHPTLETPYIDGLAGRGVVFTRAYCQAPICGPSRMSFYTGRYMFSHGSTWNNVPLDVGELTLGDYLRPLGVRTALCGKTHMRADYAGMARVGLDPESTAGRLIAECGFEPYARHDGLYPDELVARKSPAYNGYLRRHGYDGPNPWHAYANSGVGPDGAVLSGWNMRNAGLAARVKAEHSETAYVTDRAIDFIAEAGADAWCLHLSYIKPHWPYIAPAPYHALYGPNAIAAANRHPDELDDPHPVVSAFTRHDEGRAFADEATRRTVIPAYMGLIKEVDDNLGRLFALLAKNGRIADTMIVFTSDHGDYLGDHWLGEKEMFHEESVRIPMIVCDPDDAADATRGTRDDRLVEAIDLVPTFVEAVGGAVAGERLEGRSLLPLLRAAPGEPWRDAVFAEADYAFREARVELGRGPRDARAYMVRTADWKYVHFEGYRPQLFDLRTDPRELKDLGADPAHAAVRAELHERLFAWLRRRKTRRTITDDRVLQATGTAQQRVIMIGVW